MRILSSNRSQRLRRMLATLGVLVAAAGVDSIFPQIPPSAKAAQESAKKPAVREELILPGSPAQLGRAYYNPASRRWITVQSQGGKETLSGVAWASEYDNIIGPVNVSPDGRHVLHLAERSGRKIVVLDGKELGEFDATKTDLETFSPDGQHVALYAVDPGNWRIVVDGKEGPPGHGAFGMQLRIAYSPDSRRLAYATTLSTLKKKLVVDGAEVADCVAVEQLLFSPDSQHWAAAVRRGLLGKEAVLLDGQDWGGGDLWLVKRLEFNPANGELAMIGLGKRFDIIVRGLHRPNVQKKYTLELTPFRGVPGFAVWGPVFTTDGKHDVYALGETSFLTDVFADGEILWSDRMGGWRWHGEGQPSLDGFRLSGDGRHLVALMLDKDRVVVSLFLMGEDPATGHWAAVANREVEIPVPGGGGDLYAGSLILSPSGQHFAFKVLKSKKYEFLVLDGEEGPQYEKLAKHEVVMKNCFFETEDSVTCLAAKADGLYRVTQTAPSTSPWPVLADH